MDPKKHPTPSSKQRQAIVDCPVPLLDQLFDLGFPDLHQTVLQFCELRQCLNEGRCPDPLRWPTPELGAQIARLLYEKKLFEVLEDHPDWVDDFLSDLLEGLRVHQLDIQSLLSQHASDRPPVDECIGDQTPWSQEFEKEAIDLLASLAESSQDVQHLRDASEIRTSSISSGSEGPSWLFETRQIWGKRGWNFAVLQTLLGGGGKGFDLSLGQLECVDWPRLERIAKLLESRPEIASFVRKLGRELPGDSSREADSDPPALELFAPRSQNQSGAQENWGLERGDDIARMLPSEAVLLGHPELAILWHARRAEHSLWLHRRRLACQRPDSSTWPDRPPEPPAERGPILLLMDTSGSMQGYREALCKAFALAAIRLARSQDRSCLLLAYSGPGQITSLDLSSTRDRRSTLLDFLQSSFNGGSDTAGALRESLIRIREQSGAKADLTILSDGEWPLDRATQSQLADARKAGLRVFGVQFGQSATTNLSSICDEVLGFPDPPSRR